MQAKYRVVEAKSRSYVQGLVGKVKF